MPQSSDKTTPPSLAPSPTPEPLVDVKAAAHFLGVPVSWVYAAAGEGRIPRHFVGRYLRFRLSELEEWLWSGQPYEEEAGSDE
ncbi:MAG: helix-turn-helix domain-containing protein [Actinobacteria bacterium]|nr:helix-turn-helix domain-containing protein [Actinomycetota bacterium]